MNYFLCSTSKAELLKLRTELLAEAFASSFSASSDRIRINFGDADAPACNVHEILKLIVKLDEHEAPDPDGVHPSILNGLSSAIAKPI